MRSSRMWSLALAPMLAGCLIDRSALGGGASGVDGGPPDAFVAPRLDAAGLDAPGLDAFEAPIDAPDRPEPDAHDPGLPDAWMAPPPDAWMSTPDSPLPCVGGAEICNARDDNCNGAVDESGCGGAMSGVTVACIAFTHAGHVYQTCKATPVSIAWELALLACTSFPPYSLVRIDDNAENSAVSAQVREDAWLGLNDRGLEGTLLWADASPLGYESWVSGEPTSTRGASGASEDCVSMRGGSPIWEDRFCGVPSLTPGTPVSSFVCEAVIAP